MDIPRCFDPPAAALAFVVTLAAAGTSEGATGAAGSVEDAGCGCDVEDGRPRWQLLGFGLLVGLGRRGRGQGGAR